MGENVSQIEDFDAFWDAQEAAKAPRTTTIRGVVVTVPAAIPLRFELEAKRLKKAKSFEALTLMLNILVGEDTVTDLVKAGLDTDQFAVLLAWLPQLVAGVDVTLAQVAADLAAIDTDESEDDSEADPS